MVRRILEFVERYLMDKIGIIPFDTQNGAVAVLFVTSQTRGRSNAQIIAITGSVGKTTIAGCG